MDGCTLEVDEAACRYGHINYVKGKKEKKRKSHLQGKREANNTLDC